MGNKSFSYLNMHKLKFTSLNIVRDRGFQEWIGETDKAEVAVIQIYPNQVLMGIHDCDQRARHNVNLISDTAGATIEGLANCYGWELPQDFFNPSL
jgi:hypothetical protein